MSSSKSAAITFSWVFSIAMEVRYVNPSMPKKTSGVALKAA
jgi:hypothetical protein